MPTDPQQIERARDNARQRLLDRRDPLTGAFRGRLSTSALSTATACLAFSLSAREAQRHGEAETSARHMRFGSRAAKWLLDHQNEDGGFGDTTASPSNISTTTVAWAALNVAKELGEGHELERMSTGVTAAAGYVTTYIGQPTTDSQPEPAALAAAIRARYGKDHTFSVPILMTCALADLLGPQGWRLVPALPFELAAAPHQWLKWLNLRTVSYALPALIAIGQARHVHRPTRNLLVRLLRHRLRRRTLEVLHDIQPASGGYLEAAPLTSFVAMALISIGEHRHPVVTQALGFLVDTVRDDGSWPIDTNLDTWTTTLAVDALGAHDEPERTQDWLLQQQYYDEHPFTRAAPGGWAWTDLSGGVPDADDTPGALLALHTLANGGELSDSIRTAMARGVRWLLDLQNDDGGIPTFCKGWGKLPFDRSSQDLTAHALRAWSACRPALPNLRHGIDRATRRAIRYLLRTQRMDGAWLPLWFGNQQLKPEQENPLYGTSRVVQAVTMVPVRDRALGARWHEAGERGVAWLIDAARPDGAITAAPDADPSIEETALALDALARWHRFRGRGSPTLAATIDNAASWLVERTACGTQFEAAPIGLYFAKLWYSEDLYPLVFAASAFAQTVRTDAHETVAAAPSTSTP